MTPTRWGQTVFPGRGNAAWVVPSGRSDAMDPLYDIGDIYDPGSAVYVTMTPEQFLRYNDIVWARMHEITEPVHEGSDEIRQRFLRRQPVDAAWLDVVPATLELAGQDGSHRATEALRAGIRSMPVILFAYDPLGGGYVKAPVARFKRAVAEGGLHRDRVRVHRSLSRHRTTHQHPAHPYSHPIERRHRRR